MSKTNLGWFIFFWIAFTCLNIKINMYDAEKNILAEIKGTPQRQNESMYVDALKKMKTCEGTTDKENNTFYVCPDGSKISTINWTRGDNRKGIVTREYNPQGKLILIYGHPDDVY